MKRTSSQLVALGLPLAIGFISQMAISFTDAALVSHLGAAQLAGTTLALSIFSLVMLMGLGIITAVSPKVAASYRSGDMIGVRAWYVQGTWLSVVIGVIAALVLLNTRGILLLMGQTDQVATIAQRYNNGAAIGVIFFFLYVNIRSVMSAVGSPKPLTWIMISAVPVNFIVGYIAIFGIGEFGGGGVLGAGISSSVVRGCIVIIATIVLLRAPVFAPLGLQAASPRIDFQKIGGLLWVGTPIGVRILASEGFLPVFAFFVAAFGTDATAAHAVGLRIETLVSVFALGFSAAATTLAAWAWADGDWQALRRLKNALLLVSVVYVLAVNIIVATTFGFVQHTLFGVTSPQVTALLWGLLPLLLLSFTFDTVGAMYNGFLVGVQDTFLPTLVVMASYWIFGLGIGILLAHVPSLGFYGLWVGMSVAGLIITMFNVVRAEIHVRSLRQAAPMSKDATASTGTPAG